MAPTLPGRGPSVPAHQLTTRHLGAAYPFLLGSDTGARGAVIGRDLLGGVFAYDPFELYRQGVLSNPNMVVFGQIGRGKSAFVKTYLWRQAVFGHRAWVVDPKGEYHALARRWGVQPIALRPGGPVRLNPLDPAGPHRPTGGGSWLAGANGWGSSVGAPSPRQGPEASGAADQRQLALLATLATAALGRDLRPRERTALELALVTAGTQGGLLTLPMVVEALLDPAPGVAARVRTERALLVEDGRDVALELRRLVHGDLAGMFDGPTTAGIDLGAPLVVLDLSALYNSPALGILMTCATAWLQAAASGQERSTGAGHQILVVVDEAWAILTQLAVARWLQSSWKLSRARGVANMAVLHRISDLSAVGAQGSEQVGLAQGLLADSETRVVYAQPPGEAQRAAELLALSPTECELVPQLRRGVALWKLGDRSFLVQHQLSQGERVLVDTDAAMASKPGTPAP